MSKNTFGDYSVSFLNKKKKRVDCLFVSGDIAHFLSERGAVEAGKRGLYKIPSGYIQLRQIVHKVKCAHCGKMTKVDW